MLSEQYVTDATKHEIANGTTWHRINTINNNEGEVTTEEVDLQREGEEDITCLLYTSPPKATRRT